MFIRFDFEWLSSIFAVICALPFSINIYLLISNFLSHIQLLSVKKDQYSLAQHLKEILIGRLVLVLLNVDVLCQYLVLWMGSWTAQQLRCNGPIPNGTLHVHLWSWELSGKSTRWFPVHHFSFQKGAHELLCTSCELLITTDLLPNIQSSITVIKCGVRGTHGASRIQR